MTGRASSSMIFLIPQALCFRLKNQSYMGGQRIVNSDLDISSIQYTINMRYHRFEPGYLSEREKSKTENSFFFERYLHDIS